MSKGWALGGTEFRAALVHDHALVARTRAWELAGAREIREMQWTAALITLLRIAELHETRLCLMRKSSPAKLAVAAFMKARTQASNEWLSRRLHLGHPRALSHNLTQYRRQLQKTDPLWAKLTSEYSA
jgi:hypothetical protein